MHTPLRTLCCLIAACGLALCAGEAVKLEDLPAATKSAMETAANGAALTDLEKVSDGKGGALYTAKYLKDGKLVDITVNDGGKVIHKKKKKDASQ